MELGRDELLHLYYLMTLTRALEDQLRSLHRQGRIPGAIATARGLEATTVGAACALKPGDVIAPLHRDLGALLARGITPSEILSHCLGRGTAFSGGRDGQLHLGDMRDRMVLPMTGLPALALPVAVGTALGAKLRGDRRMTLAFVGADSTHAGDFHEALNLAATLDLPVVILIEHAILSPTEQTPPTRLTNLADRAAAYGIPGYVVDGNDVLAVAALTRKAAQGARSGRGPVLIEAKFLRQTIADDPIGLPATDTAESLDPIARFTRHLQQTDVLTDDLHAEYAAEVDSAISDALRQAESAPTPHAADLAAHLFVPPDAPPLGPHPEEVTVGVTLERKMVWR